MLQHPRPLSSQRKLNAHRTYYDQTIFHIQKRSAKPILSETRRPGKPRTRGLERALPNRYVQDPVSQEQEDWNELCQDATSKAGWSATREIGHSLRRIFIAQQAFQWVQSLTLVGLPRNHQSLQTTPDCSCVYNG